MKVLDKDELQKAKARLEAGGNLSVAETYNLAGVSEAKFYKDIAKGLLPIIKNGRRTLVSAEAARAYIERGTAADLAAA